MTDVATAAARQRGSQVFRVVCLAENLSQVLRDLEPWAWRDLYLYLRADYSEAGISGEVLGMMLVESGDRYAAHLAAILPPPKL